MEAPSSLSMIKETKEQLALMYVRIVKNIVKTSYRYEAVRSGDVDVIVKGQFAPRDRWDYGA